MSNPKSKELLVDQVIGSAYQVVKYVAANMDILVELSTALPNLSVYLAEVQVAMPIMSSIHANMAALVNINSNLESLLESRGIQHGPSDGVLRGSKDGSWVAIPVGEGDGGGIPITFSGSDSDGNYSDYEEVSQVSFSNPDLVVTPDDIEGSIKILLSRAPGGSLNDIHKQLMMHTEYTPGPIIEDFADTVYAFTFTGNWVRTDSVVAHSGTHCFTNGTTPNNGSSSTEILGYVVETPVSISFWSKVSTENNYDFLVFYVDGIEKLRLSGEQPWTLNTFTIPTGTHNFKWEYIKDSSGFAGDDHVYIDDVTIETTSSTLRDIALANDIVLSNLAALVSAQMKQKSDFLYYQGTNVVKQAGAIWYNQPTHTKHLMYGSNHANTTDFFFIPAAQPGVGNQIG